MPKVTSMNKLPGNNLLGKFSRAGAMRDFLSFYGFRDTAFWIDDFIGDTINLDFWAVANSSGTSAADFAANIAQSSGTGVIQSDSGTTDNGSTSIIGPIIYKGDQNCGMAARFKVDDVTSWSFDVGFIDAVPASNTAGVNDVDTPTVFMADGAVIHMNTDQTLQVPALVTVGSTANQGAKATTTGLAPANATFCTAMIQIVGNDVFAQFNNGSGQVFIEHTNGVSGNSAGHVEGGVALAPWIINLTRNTTAKFMDVDFVAVWTDRTS